MTTLTQPARLSPFAVFRHRSFTRLWLAQFVSQLGSGLTTIAAALLIYRMTGSALSVGLTLIATSLPSLLVGLLAGAVADRYDRRRIMIAADLIRAALVALIPILIPFGTAWLYVILLLSSTMTQFFDPANESLLPEVASEEELAAANALMTISLTGAQTIGFAAAGVIAAQLPIAWAFYLDALTFVLSAICIMGVRAAPLAADKQTTVATVLRQVRDGLGVVRDTVPLRSLFVLAVPLMLVFGFANTLLLPFTARALNAGEFAYGLLEGVPVLGFVLGSLLMAHLADRLHPSQWIAAGTIAMAVLYLGFAQLTAVPLAILVSTVIHFVNAPSYIGRRLIIQRQTPREMRGRVNSAFFVARDLFFLLGMAAAGLADLIDVRMLWTVGGLVLLVAGLLAVMLPGLRQPASEWRHAIRLLRGAQAAPALGLGRAAVMADIERLIAQNRVFASLSPADRRMLAAHARVYTVSAETTIIRHGELGAAAYFVLEGWAAAVRDVEGGYQMLSTVPAGDLFGEIAALTGAPRTATVRTVPATTVLEVPATTLRHLMRDTQVHGVVLGRMVARIARTTTEMLAPLDIAKRPIRAA
jgi:MFS family permease